MPQLSVAGRKKTAQVSSSWLESGKENNDSSLQAHLVSIVTRMSHDPETQLVAARGPWKFSPHLMPDLDSLARVSPTDSNGRVVTGCLANLPGRGTFTAQPPATEFLNLPVLLYMIKVVLRYFSMIIAQRWRETLLLHECYDNYLFGQYHREFACLKTTVLTYKTKSHQSTKWRAFQMLFYFFYFFNFKRDNRTMQRAFLMSAKCSRMVIRRFESVQISPQCDIMNFDDAYILNTSL